MSEEKKVPAIVAVILLMLQLGAGIAAIVELFILNMLPDRYLFAIIIGLIVLLAASGELFFLGLRAFFDTNAGKALRIVGYALSGIAIATSIMISVYVGILNHTMETISKGEQDCNLISVYVLEDSEAKNIEDLLLDDAVFGKTINYDYEHTMQAIKTIQEEEDTILSIEGYSEVTDMVDALYRGDVDAIILNQSYSGVLRGMKKYKKFEKETKIVHTVELVDEVEEEVEPEAEVNLPLTERTFCIYLSGNDTRNSMLTTGHSDLNILALVNPKTKRILLVNTPRDFYIETAQADFQDMDKLTHCGIYGVQCSMDSLSHLYDVDMNVEYYAQINFTGFETLIDDIGGVSLENETSFTSKDGYQYPTGTIHLDGKRALSFARERKAFAAGDNKRGENQMLLIKAIVNQLMGSTAVLSNYSDIMKDLEGMFTTNFTTEEMSELVRFQLNGNYHWQIDSVAAVGEGASKTTYTTPNQRCYVMIPDEEVVEEIKKRIDAMIQ